METLDIYIYSRCNVHNGINYTYPIAIITIVTNSFHQLDKIYMSFIKLIASDNLIHVINKHIRIKNK